jgi:hypothetical protein
MNAFAWIWFAQLPVKYKNKAIDNARNNFLQFDSLLKALGTAFIWENTPEGRDFWLEAYKEIQKGTFVPEMQKKVLPDVIKGVFINPETQKPHKGRVFKWKFINGVQYYANRNKTILIPYENIAVIKE